MRIVEQMLDEPEAVALATRLNAEAKATKAERGEKDRYSVIGTPDAVFFVEEVYGAEASKEVPHYC